jgi:tRNA (adenine22-N1)-methyltransferase
MNLSKRLQKVLDFVEVTDNVADIGADHGYLTIAMREKGVKYLQVVENKKGPLNRAKQNLVDYDNIIFSLSDGISDIDSSIDTVTICGMGGLNIVEILSDHLDTAKKLKKIIMQANSKTYELIEFLVNNSFSIIDEEMVKDGDKYYEIIVASYDGVQKNFSYHELFFGPILLQKMSLEFVEYYQTLKQNFKNILADNQNREMTDLKNKIELIEKYIRGEQDVNN